jgi:hypothetical protein
LLYVFSTKVFGNWQDITVWELCEAVRALTNPDAYQAA